MQEFYRKYKRYIWIGGILVVGVFVYSAVATPQPVSTQPASTLQVTQPAQTTPVSSPLSNNNSYVNSSGNTVHSPAYNSTNGTVPIGATAQCRDGTYSFSQHRSGTCSYHGGVSRWL